MKTKIALILPALLVLLLINTTEAGNKTLIPVSDHNSIVVVDTAGLTSKPAMQPVNEEEAYVEDIPFNTKEIMEAYLIASLPEAEPEAYINDIPFRTDSIARKFLPVQMTGLYPEIESYINDIPFNTENIASKYLCRESGKYCYRVTKF